MDSPSSQSPCRSLSLVLARKMALQLARRLLRSFGTRILHEESNPLPIRNIPNSKHHISKSKSTDATLNCTAFLVQDWQYQDMMGYDEETRQRLIYGNSKSINDNNDALLQWTLPPYLESSKCKETPEHLAAFVASRLGL